MVGSGLEGTGEGMTQFPGLRVVLVAMGTPLHCTGGVMGVWKPSKLDPAPQVWELKAAGF